MKIRLLILVSFLITDTTSETMGNMRLFLFGIFVSATLQAQDKPESFCRNGMNLKGNVTSISERTFEGDKRGNAVGDEFETKNYFFNEKGQLTKIEEINAKGRQYLTGYTYDANGCMIEKINGDPDDKEDFTYRLNGNTITQVANGDAVAKQVFVFDEMKRLVEWRIHRYSETEYFRRFRITYNTSGKIVEFRRDGGFKDSDEKVTFVYDDQGNVVRETLFNNKNGEEKSITKYKYTYDEQGNWITRLHSTESNGDDFGIFWLTKRRYTYGPGSMSANQALIGSEFGAAMISGRNVSSSSSSATTSGSSVNTSSLSAWDCYMRAQDYYYGRNGQSSDYGQAMRWYRSAADKGLTIAMRDIAYLYKSGKGVTVDYTEAVRWYRMAADRGDASSMNSLGYRYDQGTGVARDYAEAMRWYQKAAALGNAAAMYNIGLLYKNGQGVSSSLTEAKKWFQLSADGGDEDAKEQLKKL